ncbi:hypothetical protein LCGC14_2121970 [marine sediment metagenome]|uniref:Uncharacterized protein n=1 Tax=marine sediment metagenome TaxID=412755 RepID=A0A0F9E412_9ZZZZ
MCVREKLRKEALKFYGQSKTDELVSKQCCKDAQVKRLTTALERLGGEGENGTWHLFGCSNGGFHAQAESRCNKPCGDTHAAFSSVENQVEEALEFFLGLPEGEHFSREHRNIYGECRCSGCNRLRFALGIDRGA